MSESTRRFLAPYLDRHDLIEEFRAAPLGPYSDELLHLLTVIRGTPANDKYALIEIEPGKNWMLATLPGERGQAPMPIPEYRFASLEEAEWTVFRLRWKFWTGEELEP